MKFVIVFIFPPELNPTEMCALGRFTSCFWEIFFPALLTFLSCWKLCVVCLFLWRKREEKREFKCTQKIKPEKNKKKKTKKDKNKDFVWKDLKRIGETSTHDIMKTMFPEGFFSMFFCLLIKKFSVGKEFFVVHSS